VRKTRSPRASSVSCTSFETVLFPRAYREYGEELEEERPYVIRGRVEDDMGAVYINVRELKAVK